MADHSITAVHDRVKETTTTTGTGTVTLAGAESGFTGFSDVFSDTNTTYYTLISGNETDWESGIGTFTSSGDTLARTTVLSNSAGTTAKISLTGTSTVFCSYPAGESLHGLGSGGKMVQTSAQTWTAGALNQIAFDSTAAPGFPATGDAVVLDTTNNKITLKKKGWYQLTGMVSAENADAYGDSAIWITIGTSAALADQINVAYFDDPNTDLVYGTISTAYYCDSPDDDVFLCVWPSAGGGASEYWGIVSEERYKPKFSAVFVR